MSKTQFRSRPIDHNRVMPIFVGNEVPDVAMCVTASRAVPAMPTGMEKEEELELHLQNAITAQQDRLTAASASQSNKPNSGVIPVPKVSSDVSDYGHVYPTTYRPSKSYLRYQGSLSLRPEVPDYDCDSDDESWLSRHKCNGLVEINHIDFETIMDRLEKASERQVASLREAKALCHEIDDDVVIDVYDYWLSKRLVKKQSLIPTVRQERRDGTPSIHNPYMAFRRRQEKRQTRTNRKNDEESYEKMMRLKLDLKRVVALLDMVKRREKTKRESVRLDNELFEKRSNLEDWNGELHDECSSQPNANKPYQLNSLKELHQIQMNKKRHQGQHSGRKRKRRQGHDGFEMFSYVDAKPSTYFEQQQHGLTNQDWLAQKADEWNGPPNIFGAPTVTGTQTSLLGYLSTSSASEDAAEPTDGDFVFRRKRGCRYYKAVDSSSESDSNLSSQEIDSVYPTWVNDTDEKGHRCIGMAKRRLGRGGRICLDRVPPLRCFSKAKATILGLFDLDRENTGVKGHSFRNKRNDFLYFYPPSSSKNKQPQAETRFASQDMEIFGTPCGYSPSKLLAQIERNTNYQNPPSVGGHALLETNDDELVPLVYTTGVSGSPSAVKTSFVAGVQKMTRLHLDLTSSGDDVNPPIDRIDPIRASAAVLDKQEVNILSKEGTFHRPRTELEATSWQPKVGHESSAFNNEKYCSIKEVGTPKSTKHRITLGASTSRSNTRPGCSEQTPEIINKKFVPTSSFQINGVNNTDGKEQSSTEANHPHLLAAVSSCLPDTTPNPLFDHSHHSGRTPFDTAPSQDVMALSYPLPASLPTPTPSPGSPRPSTDFSRLTTTKFEPLTKLPLPKTREKYENNNYGGKASHNLNSNFPELSPPDSSHDLIGSNSNSTANGEVNFSCDDNHQSPSYRGATVT